MLDDIGREIVARINKNHPGYLAHFAFTVSYHPHVSNSHCSPVGKPSNFCRVDDTPTGYKGYQGRLWVIYNKEPPSFGSDLLSGTGIYSGTGGGGFYDNPHYRVGVYPCGWDCKIWHDDFPELSAAQLEHDRVCEAQAQLSGTVYNPYPHHFSWVDPEFKAWAEAQIATPA